MEILDGFVDWTVARGSVNKVLGKLSRAIDVLIRAEMAATTSGQPYSEVFQEILEPEEIRLSGLFGMYLKEVGLLVESSSDRMERSDRRRISELMAQSDGRPWGDWIRRYARLLAGSERTVSVMTQRVYLGVAFRFMEHAGVDQPSDVAESHIGSFLRKSPGSRASLFPWINFLRAVGLHPPEIPKKSASKGRTIDEASRSVASILQALQENQSTMARKALTAKLIAECYGIPLDQVLELTVQHVRGEEGLMEVRIGSDWLPVPLGIAQSLLRIMPRPKSRDSEQSLLFSGRLMGDSLATSSVKYHVRKHIGKR